MEANVPCIYNCFVFQKKTLVSPCIDKARLGSLKVDLVFENPKYAHFWWRPPSGHARISFRSSHMCLSTLRAAGKITTACPGQAHLQ